jgi:hypothetical protein
MGRTFKTKVYLGSNMVINNSKEKPKRQFFSIVYITPKNKNMYMDLTGFRPDPLDYLSPDKKYEAVLTFKKELNEEGIYVDFLQNIKVGNLIFLKIR